MLGRRPFVRTFRPKTMVRMFDTISTCLPLFMIRAIFQYRRCGTDFHLLSLCCRSRSETRAVLSQLTAQNPMIEADLSEHSDYLPETCKRQGKRSLGFWDRKQERRAFLITCLFCL